VGTGMGLDSAEATVSAGICSNLVLAPITGPLDKLATFAEVAGLAVGLAIGPHSLILACLKPLLHSQVEHFVSRALLAALDGPGDGPAQAPYGPETLHDLHWPAYVGRGVLPTEVLLDPALETRHHSGAPASRGALRDELKSGDEALLPQWLCLGFTAHVPASPRGAATDVPPPSTPAGASLSIVVLPLGDDAFLRALSASLEQASRAPRTKSTSGSPVGVPAGRFLLVSNVGGMSGRSGGHSQPACQHPGCSTGRCAPPGSYPCSCRCTLCRP
jgi:hypothetical protein